jgi:hypothetical protein
MPFLPPFPPSPLVLNSIQVVQLPGPSVPFPPASDRYDAHTADPDILVVRYVEDNLRSRLRKEHATTTTTRDREEGTRCCPLSPPPQLQNRPSYSSTRTRTRIGLNLCAPCRRRRTETTEGGRE